MIFWLYVAVVLVIAFSVAADEGEAGPFFGVCVLGAVLGVFIFGVGRSAWVEDRPSEVVTKDLVTLADGTTTKSELSGAFVLIAGGISGSSEEEVTYTWYERDADGGIRLQREDADSDRIRIFEDAAGPGVAEVTYETEVGYVDVPWWFGPGFLDGTEPDSEDTNTELHVPPGTVTRDFQLDAK
jgi:hypothetical protein